MWPASVQIKYFWLLFFLICRPVLCMCLCLVQRQINFKPFSCSEGLRNIWIIHRLFCITVLNCVRPIFGLLFWGVQFSVLWALFHFAQDPIVEILLSGSAVVSKVFTFQNYFYCFLSLHIVYLQYFYVPTETSFRVRLYSWEYWNNPSLLHCSFLNLTLLQEIIQKYCSFCWLNSDIILSRLFTRDYLSSEFEVKHNLLLPFIYYEEKMYWTRGFMVMEEGYSCQLSWF